MKFEDVVKCSTIAELNTFTRRYIEERGLEGEAATKTMWALFYKWKEAICLGKPQVMCDAHYRR